MKSSNQCLVWDKKSDLMREREDTRANLRANKAAAQHSADPGPNHRRMSNTDAISWQEVTSGTTHIQRIGSVIKHIEDLGMCLRPQLPRVDPSVSQPPPRVPTSTASLWRLQCVLGGLASVPA